MIHTKRTEREIYVQIDKASKAINERIYVVGLSYEDGVIAALKWILSDDFDSPPPMEMEE